jgi:hypothetical protein
MVVLSFFSLSFMKKGVTFISFTCVNDHSCMRLDKKKANSDELNRDVHRGAAAAGFFKELTRRGSGRFFKIHCGSGAAAVDFLKIHRGSGSIFFEDIEKVHEFDRILVFTSETS